MPLPLTAVANIWVRDKWQTERNTDRSGVKVPKGAVKAVSMGDTLEKFHKANALGLKKGLEACKTLKKNLTAYKVGIKAKYKAFHDRIERQLEYFVDQYIHDAEKVIAEVSNYTTTREAAATALMPCGYEFMQWEKGNKSKAFKPSNEKDLVDKLTKFVEMCGKMVYYSDTIDPALRKQFDQTVYAASAGTWNKPTVEGLIDQMKKFPNKA
jgi:hypothetical protein